MKDVLIVVGLVLGVGVAAVAVIAFTGIMLWVIPWVVHAIQQLPLPPGDCWGGCQ